MSTLSFVGVTAFEREVIKLTLFFGVSFEGEFQSILIQAVDREGEHRFAILAVEFQEQNEGYFAVYSFPGACQCIQR